ncbi:MAG TPA: UGSC family (seleno)protein, partial [Casimicrobiaceae bacterium]|nr:UGSC family (seleno)protein [Casimicrobiaceae bacterium]
MSEISFFTDDYESAVERFYSEGWTDGLPVVLPTRKLVDALLAGVRRDRDETLGVMPPKGGRITIEKLAINAVMGGCTPA